MKLPRLRRPTRPSRPAGPALLTYARREDIQALFEILGMIATTTTWQPRPDIQQIDRFISAHLPASEREFAISCFLHGTTISKMREAVVKRAFQLYGFRDYSEPDRWITPLQVLDILLRVALTEGEFTVVKRHIIDYTRQTLGVHNRAFWILRDTIAHKLGVRVEREGVSFFDASASSDSDTGSRTIRAPSLPRSDALTRLGLSESATPTEIKSRYRSLVKECHPDLVAAKGDDQAMKTAALRFCELQEAYETLCDSLTT